MLSTLRQGFFLNHLKLFGSNDENAEVLGLGIEPSLILSAAK